MMEPEYRSEIREYTPEEQKFFEEAQAKLAENYDALMAQAQEIATRLYAEDDELEPLFSALRNGRESQGISLEDMAARLEMKAEKLEQFEKQVLAHPSIKIIQRYAKEIGKKLAVELVPIE